MAREISFAKRAKISQAQQYMLLSVLGASVILGASVSLIMHFFSQISFNAKVVSEEDNSIVVYSDAIKISVFVQNQTVVPIATTNSKNAIQTALVFLVFPAVFALTFSKTWPAMQH